LFNPLLIYDVSFILTFSAMAGLLYFSDIFGSDLFNKAFFGKRYAVSALSVNSVILPVCYSLFGRISLWGLASNFFAGTAIGFVMVLVIIIVLFSGIFPFLRYILSPVMDFLVKYIFKIMSVPKTKMIFDISAYLPITCAFILVIFLYFLLKTLFCKNRRRISALSSILCIILIILCYKASFSDNKAYIAYVGNSIGVDVIHKNNHYIICNAEDLSDSTQQFPFNVGTKIKSIFIMDTNDKAEEIITEFLQNYKTENIFVNEETYSLFSTDLKKISHILDKNHYNDGFIKVCDKGLMEFEVYKKRFVIPKNIKYTAFEAPKEKDCVLLISDYGNKKYRILFEKMLKFDKSVVPIIKSDGYEDFICTSDYSMITVNESGEIYTD